MPTAAYCRLKMITTMACVCLVLSSCAGQQALKAQQPPLVLSKTSPKYTKEALSKGIEGVVDLLLTINAEGQVIKVQVTKGLGFGLDESAKASVFKWKFKPAIKDGVPMKSEKKIRIRFTVE